MSLSDVSAEGVQSAVAECRRVGRPAFLEQYGFGPARGYVLVVDGEEFDSKAICGVAHRYDTGEVLRAGQFSGGRDGAAGHLRSLGFDVRGPDADELTPRTEDISAPSWLSVEDTLAVVPADLRAGLRWFHDRTGEEIPWPAPSPVPELEHLVTAPKGIYKPGRHRVALSVRQTIDSPYADHPIVDLPGGGWAYAYHQEGDDPAARDADFTNVALIENIRQRVPVAVLIQTAKTPTVRYRVQGLAMVTRWDAGYFYLQGFGPDGMSYVSAGATESAVMDQEAAAAIARQDDSPDPIDPEHDARVRALAEVARRQGQGQFREALLTAYSGRCAITGCDVVQVLDAAHIQPYRGAHTNITPNGLLLRSDIHALFDLGLIAIDPTDGTILVSTQLDGTDYEHLRGTTAAEPVRPADRPMPEGLNAHLEWCGDRLTRPATD